MEVLKRVLLMLVLVFASTVVANIYLKYLLTVDVLLIDYRYFFLGLTLPAILMLFEKDMGLQRLALVSVFYPFLMRLASHYLSF